jgi:hypothetical protein
MMPGMRKKWIALLAGAAFSAGGCGTVCNLASRHPEPYGGLARDLAVLAACPPLEPGGGGSGEAVFFCAVLGVCAGEFCATGLGDTLTLPLVDRLAANKEREKSADGSACANLPVQWSSSWDLCVDSPPDEPTADGVGCPPASDSPEQDPPPTTWGRCPPSANPPVPPSLFLGTPEWASETTPVGFGQDQTAPPSPPASLFR